MRQLSVGEEMSFGGMVWGELVWANSGVELWFWPGQQVRATKGRLFRRQAGRQAGRQGLSTGQG